MALTSITSPFRGKSPFGAAATITVGRYAILSDGRAHLPTFVADFSGSFFGSRPLTSADYRVEQDYPIMVVDPASDFYGET